MLEYLIFDRTAADLAEARRIVDSGRDIPEYLKGMYGIVDLNRVGAALNEVRALLLADNYVLVNAAKVNWNVGEYVTPALNTDLFTVYNAIWAILRQKGGLPPKPVTLDMLDIDKANALERILFDFGESVQLLRDDYLYCGDAWACDDKDDQHRDDYNI
ncbi:hypothetical protein FACS1894171_2440 [Clostridia bacterium]|nr:hypothetical protein FACS1894171_2440 [Clostridia bacterium]